MSPRRVEHLEEGRFISLVREKVRREARILRRKAPPLRALELEDLVQDSLVKCLAMRDTYEGRGNPEHPEWGPASLESWAGTIARNHMVSMARRLAVKGRAPATGFPGLGLRRDPGLSLEERAVLGEKIAEFVAWAREQQDVPAGGRVVELMVSSGGQLGRVAVELTLETSQTWTESRVRSVLNRLRGSAPGEALCLAAGLR